MRKYLLAILLCLLASPAHAILVQTGSYTGDGLDDKAIALGSACTPSVVMVKRNTAATHAHIAMSSMPAGEAMSFTGASGTPSTTCIKSLTATGFTLGTSSSCNASGVTHHYLALCDNGAGDLAVGIYTGDTLDNRDIVISPAFPPEIVVVVPESTAGRYWRGATSHSGDSASRVNAADVAVANAIQAFNADGFEVGTVLNAAVDHYYMAIKGNALGVVSGNFTGNTSDDRDITAGFLPEFVMVKTDSGTDGPSYRFSSNSAGESYCLSEAVSVNTIQAFGTTTFQVGTDTCANENTVTMRWFALTDVSTRRHSQPIPLQ